MSRESWLDSESSKWVSEGLISEDARRAILARERAPQSDPSNTLRTLAVLTAGVGVVLFVAWHWQDLPRSAKVGLTSLLTIALYAGAARSVDRRSRAVTERWLLGAVLSGCALLSAIADVSLWNAPVDVALLCAIAAAVTAAATRSALVTALAAVTLGWWEVASGGGVMPWPFLLVFPLVAFAAQSARHLVLAVLTAVVFAGWAMFMALNTWHQGVMAMIMLLLGGAALEQWSRRPEARRPVFAHAPTGTAVSLIGLTAALITAVHAPDVRATLMPFTTHAAQSPWPALVLGFGLAVIGLGPFPGAGLRPRLVVACAVLWFTTSLFAHLTPSSAWLWVVLFSAVLLAIGASLVRDGAATRDRVTLGLGLAAVIALVLVHFSSGQPLMGAVVLLLSGAVLYAAARAKSPEAAS